MSKSNESQDKPTDVINKNVLPIEGVDSDDGDIIYNNWSNENEKTVKDWKTTIARSCFVYEVVKEKYSNKLHSVLIALLVMNGINTILSAISAAIVGTNTDDPTMVWVSFGFLVAITIVEGVTFILTGCVKIYKWDDLVSRLSAFIQRLDNFYAIVSSELVLPDKLRREANDFIIKQDEQFLQIMQQSPDINPSDHYEANQLFERFINDNSLNYKFAQKYNYNEGFVDV